MGRTVKTAMQYERAGEMKSKKQDVERTIFRDMAISTMLMALGHEMWRRYSTEILATALFMSWAIYIWSKLG